MNLTFPTPGNTIATGLLLLVFFPFMAHAADPLKSAIDAQVSGQQETVESQARIDTLADETQSMIDQYRQAQNQLDEILGYNDQLERLIQRQDEELDTFSRQMTNIRINQRKIIPLMLEMTQVLDEFVRLDVPFLQQERQSRLANLKKLMDQPDVSMPEKYRRLLEAYQIEEGYGRSLEAYSGTLEQEGQDRPVEFLRIGRLALIYETLDGSETGYWDQDERKWKALPPEYNQAIGQGLKIARKEAPPDLVKIPVPAPEVKQ